MENLCLQFIYLIKSHVINLPLMAELNHTIFREYELEKDNEYPALRQLNAQLKAKAKSIA